MFVWKMAAILFQPQCVHTILGQHVTTMAQAPTITPAPYMVLPLFATRFADYAGGIRVSFI